MKRASLSLITKEDFDFFHAAVTKELRKRTVFNGADENGITENFFGGS